MRTHIALLIGGAALILLSSGCSGGHGASMTPAPPSMPATLDLDTAALLNLIETKTSETDKPFEVDNGAVALTPADDETGAPVSVNAT